MTCSVPHAFLFSHKKTEKRKEMGTFRWLFFSQPVKVLGIWGEGRNRQKDEARDFQIQADIKVITQNEKDPEKDF